MIEYNFTLMPFIFAFFFFVQLVLLVLLLMMVMIMMMMMMMTMTMTTMLMILSVAELHWYPSEPSRCLPLILLFIVKNKIKVRRNSGYFFLNSSYFLYSVSVPSFLPSFLPSWSPKALVTVSRKKSEHVTSSSASS